MSSDTDYEFIETDTDTIISAMVTAYETLTGTTVEPASPEKLFIQWVADIVIQERVLANYIGNQNIPSRAVGANLDALGETIYGTTRPLAQAAVCTVRFTISEAQAADVLIPSGTRVTDTSGGLVWATGGDAYVLAGHTYADVAVTCQTEGSVGNDYAIGQISTAIDLIDYYLGCANTTKSDGGSDEASDEEYYELLLLAQDTYSTAGAVGSYVYHAKQVSTEIADIVANTPSAGEVTIYTLMDDGSIAGTEIKSAILTACNSDYVRPLTDSVSVEDPETVSYNIAFTYYIPNDSSMSTTEIAAAVDKAVASYVAWQSGKLGRDINPSYLIGLLMQTGIKRVDLTYPEYTVLNDGSDNDAPEIATVGTITATNGGYENG